MGDVIWRQLDPTVSVPGLIRTTSADVNSQTHFLVKPHQKSEQILCSLQNTRTHIHATIKKDRALVDLRRERDDVAPV